MESNANYSLVGFVSGLVFLLAAAFFYWYVVADSRTDTVAYDVVFTGTVTGLASGTDVLFNGIEVGQVGEVALDPEDPSRVIARIEVAPTAPIKVDTRALLEFQGLTGMPYVQLSGGDRNAPPLRPQAGRTVAVILAEKSDFQSIVDGVRDTIVDASDSFGRLKSFLDDNEGNAAAILANMEAFTGALAANSEGVETFLASLSEAGKEIGPLAAELRTLSSDLRGLIGDVEPGQLAKIVEDVSGFTGTLANGSSQIDTFLADATVVATTFKGYAEDLGPGVTALSGTLEGIDPEAVQGVVTDLAAFSDTLGNNTETVDNFFGDMAEVGTLLNDASQRIDGILSRVDTMAAGANDEGLFADLASAAQAIETLATNLDTRTATIASDAGGGLGQFENFAVEAQAVLARLDRILSNLERNPQSVIFGGSSGAVRDYSKE